MHEATSLERRCASEQASHLLSRTPARIAALVLALATLTVGAIQDGAPTPPGAAPHALFDVGAGAAFAATTTTTLPGTGGCALEPLPACRTSRKARLIVVDKDDDTRDRLKWYWLDGVPTSKDDFGDPATTSSYMLCIYDRSNEQPALVAALEVPPSAEWDDRGDKGFRYRDGEGLQDGVTSIKLVPDDSGEASIRLVAKGTSIGLPSAVAADRYFEQDKVVTAQLQTSDGECWTSAFAEVHDKKHTASRFKGKVDGKQPHVYIVMHLDPQRTTSGNWERLRQYFAYVASRQRAGFDHRLTLMFSPEWSPYILDPSAPERLIEASTWSAAGHEFGLHHHTPGHQNPNGFAQDPAYRCPVRCCKYRGPGCDASTCSTDDAVDLVRELVENPAIGQTLHTGGAVDCGFPTESGLTFYEELPGDVVFSTTGYAADNDEEGWWEDELGNNDPSTILGRVECFAPPQYPNARSQGVKAIPHAQYFNENNRPDELPLDAVQAALEVAGKNDYIGIVWHEDGYSSADPNDPSAVETAEEQIARERVQALFAEIESRGLASRTVSEILVTPDCE